MGIVAAVFTLAAGVIAAAGMAAFHLGARLVVGRLWTPGWAWRTAVVGVLLVAVAGLWYLSTRVPDVGRLQARTAADLYYLGDEFEGYRLTMPRPVRAGLFSFMATVRADSV